MEETQLEFSQYDSSGGELSINFTNTVNWRGNEQDREDNLATYKDFLLWCFEAGLLTRGEHERLVEISQAQPARAEAALTAIKEVREITYRILRSLVEDQLPAEQDQWLFNDALHCALNHRQVEILTDHAHWVWDGAEGDFEAPLWPVILAAAELFVSDDLRKVHTCTNEACGWIFLDQSRNQSRKWCSSEACGNRARVRKFYQRSKSRSAEE